MLTALFIACTSIIISPRFLLQHARVLAIGTALVMTVKTALVAGTVSWFGHSWRLSLAVGVTMSHVGEFAFVLLSASVHLDILPPQVCGGRQGVGRGLRSKAAQSAAVSKAVGTCNARPL